METYTLALDKISNLIDRKNSVPISKGTSQATRTDRPHSFRHRRRKLLSSISKNTRFPSDKESIFTPNTLSSKQVISTSQKRIPERLQEYEDTLLQPPTKIRKIQTEKSSLLDLVEKQTALQALFKEVLLNPDYGCTVEEEDSNGSGSDSEEDMIEQEDIMEDLIEKQKF